MRIKPTAITAVNMGTAAVITLGVPIIYGKEIDSLISNFKAGNEYEIKLIRKKRSLNANAYFWVLADKIAKKINSTKERVYCNIVAQVGVFETLSFTSYEAMQRFKREWRQNGLGWVTRTIDKENFVIQAYYGSSRYTTAEMSVLVDFAVEAAKEMGIEVLTPEELERLKEDWNAKDSDVVTV